MMVDYDALSLLILPAFIQTILASLQGLVRHRTLLPLQI